MSLFRASSPAAALAVVTLFVPAGCSSGKQKPEPPTAQERYRQVIVEGHRAGPQAVESLIGYLDDPDIAVREQAIRSLVKKTGMDWGYHYAMPANQREAAIQRWKTFLESAQDPASGGTPDSASQSAKTPPPTSSAPQGIP